MRIYFARHGESEANILQEFSNRGRKHGLTEKGKRQAERLADNLKSVPFRANMDTEKPGRGFNGSEITVNRPFRHNGSYTHLCLFEHTTPLSSTRVKLQRSC